MRERILNVVTCHELPVARSSPHAVHSWPVRILRSFKQIQSLTRTNVQVGLSSISGPAIPRFKWRPPPTGGWLYDESTSLGAPPNAYQVQALAHAFSLALRQEQLRNERYTCFWRLRLDGMVTGQLSDNACQANMAVAHAHQREGGTSVLTDFM